VACFRKAYVTAMVAADRDHKKAVKGNFLARAGPPFGLDSDLKGRGENSTDSEEPLPLNGGRNSKGRVQRQPAQGGRRSSRFQFKQPASHQPEEEEP